MVSCFKYFTQIPKKDIAGREGKRRISQLFERFQSGSGKVLLKTSALSPFYFIFTYLNILTNNISTSATVRLEFHYAWHLLPFSCYLLDMLMLARLLENEL